MENIQNIGAVDGNLKLEYHKKMVGKRIFVVSNGGYYGTVSEVMDAEHFRIKPDKGEDRVVEIFDVRSIEE